MNILHHTVINYNGHFIVVEWVLFTPSKMGQKVKCQLSSILHYM